MDKPLCEEDFAAMENQLKGCVEEDRKHWRVNDVKIDAIYTAKTYEEFAYMPWQTSIRPARFTVVTADACNPRCKISLAIAEVFVSRDRVAAAHLQPLQKSDFKNKSNNGWNQYASKEKNIDE